MAEEQQQQQQQQQSWGKVSAAAEREYKD